jgi:hypothetical protein
VRPIRHEGSTFCLRPRWKPPARGKREGQYWPAKERDEGNPNAREEEEVHAWQPSQATTGTS